MEALFFDHLLECLGHAVAVAILLRPGGYSQQPIEFDSPLIPT
jgi:hypothetical protein